MDEIQLLRAIICDSIRTVHATRAGHRAEDVATEVVFKVLNTGAQYGALFQLGHALLVHVLV